MRRARQPPLPHPGGDGEGSRVLQRRDERAARPPHPAARPSREVGAIVFRRRLRTSTRAVHVLDGVRLDACAARGVYLKAHDEQRHARHSCSFARRQRLWPAYLSTAVGGRRPPRPRQARPRASPSPHHQDPSSFWGDQKKVSPPISIFKSNLPNSTNIYPAGDPGGPPQYFKISLCAVATPRARATRTYTRIGLVRPKPCQAGLRLSHEPSHFRP